MNTNTTAIQQREHAKHAEVTYRPGADFIEFSDRYEMVFDLPGATADSVSLTIDEGVLTLEASVRRDGDERGPSGDNTWIAREFGVGDFRRRVRIGEDIDDERMTASLTEGVLTVTLPKRAARQARRIEINPS